MNAVGVLSSFGGKVELAAFSTHSVTSSVEQLDKARSAFTACRLPAWNAWNGSYVFKTILPVDFRLFNIFRALEASARSNMWETCGFN